MRKKPKIAVVRGTREAVMKFYVNFEKFNVKFIAASFRPYKYTRHNKNFEFTNLAYYKPFLIDPASIFSQYGNLSFVYIKDLEKDLEGCDLVNISDTYYFSCLQAVRWAKKNKLPVVTVIWCTIPNHITSWFPPYSYITKKVVEATDLFILRSKSVLAFTDSLKIPRKKVRVIYKGIDLDKFKTSTINHKPSSLKILFTGNLSRAKGLDDLIFCYLSLVTMYSKLKLVIAGDGEMRPYVEKLSKRGLVDYRGFVDYEKLPKLYQEADIYCAPSKFRKILGIKVWEEYFSYALMEALGSGLPIVATKTGGIPEEVGSKNLLVSPGDRGELENALERLILDAKLRERLGKENRERAERLFDVKIQAKLSEDEIINFFNLDMRK